MPDGSSRVTPMGTHKLQVAWLCDEAWIAKEKVAPDQAARGEGVELASAEEAVEHLKTRFGAQARAVAMLPIKFLPMTYHDMEELTQEKQGSFLAASASFAAVVGHWTTGGFSKADLPDGLYVHPIPKSRRLVKYDVQAFAWLEDQGSNSQYRCTFHLVDLDSATGYPVRLEIRRVGTHAIYEVP